MSKIIVLALSVLALVGCAPRVVVDAGSGGDAGHAESTSTTASSSSATTGAGGDEQGGSAPQGGASDVGGGGGEGPCGDAALEACKAKADACEPSSDCYTFKACYEDVQADPAAVAACVAADPTGASAWADLVACECACDWAPAGFCDGSAYGHPSG